MSLWMSRAARGAAALVFCIAASAVAKSTHAEGTSMRPMVEGDMPPVVQSGQAQEVGPVAPSSTIRFAIALAPQNQIGLEGALQRVADPSSPQYRKYLTLNQENALYNPTQSEEDQVVQWLTQHGLTVSATYPNHLMVDALGPASLVGPLLGVALNNYTADVNGHGVSFYSANREPSVEASVASVVSGVIGLSNFPRFHMTTNGVAGGTAPYYPQDFANAYDVNPLWNAGDTGAGQHIGITLWTVPPTDSTLSAFASHTGASVATTANGRLQVIRVDGGTTTADLGEAGLDIESASGIAPGATIDYYEAPTDSQGNPTDQGLLDVLNLAGTDSNGNRLISSSWGGCEASSATDSWTQAAERIFAANSATGHNYLFSSGDNGSSCDATTPGVFQTPYPEYPASSPNVTSVGGTAFVGTVNGTWPGETAWRYTGGSSPVGSGGGFSSIFSRPSWQRGPGTGAGAQRGYPDIAADADPGTGAYVCYGASPQCAQFGGTSLASPLTAGLLTLVNQYAQSQGKGDLGPLNPALYSLAAGTQMYPAFHDETSGSNGSYSCTVGWDAVTGLGSLDAWNLARDLAASSTSTGATITASPNPVAAGSGNGTTTISWNVGNGTTGQVYVSVNGAADTLFAEGASGSATASWITSGATYAFKLYGGTNHTTVAASVTVTRSAPTVNATPNPVSTSGGSGTTSISWNTGDGSTGQVYVSVDGGTDTLFTQGSTGTSSAPWIASNHSYEFKLYTGMSHVTVLATVTVTAASAARISATPNPVAMTGGSGTTSISWTTGDGTTGQVYVEENGSADVLFSQGVTGTAPAPWITTGNVYTFKLYAGTSHSTLLGSVTVKGS